MWVPPPHPDPELEARYGRRSLRDKTGGFFLGMAAVVLVLVVASIVAALLV